MKKNKTLNTFHKITFLLLFSAVSSTSIQAEEHSNFHSLAPDSVGTETINGQRYVIHKLNPKDTYYQLGRQYNVVVKDIMEANNKKNLRVGDTVKIPRGRAVSATPPAVVAIPPSNKKEINNDPKQILVNLQDILTEYKVGKSETLYAIARRFGTNVNDIKRINGLTSDSLREGQLLKIPNGDLPEPIVEKPIEVPIIIEQHQPIDDSDFKPNKYGIREKKEKGIGVWMENLESDGQSNLALHKTAPVGTVLKITNPMTRNVTFAKVVGKFADNADTQDAIVVLSKSAASFIGALDRKFQIEITYGIPLE
ncbi:LysM peptidoglycan-binding domain-containing protein [Sphingobacterium olei]|uniref:LysM peptidoglycan-binding domain-containing protein n=1 Tax=Sphingobacterium olei TaxID=2571155 RepID=A0A4U0PJL7_9SPHI|nr:LysM peptidoglycan-binding domain-containing protein [Sphingobacterium olei]TJZ63094.1 LysM peptidoglycan-binding domain-containing protein [Sphingobacterium olei]